MLYLGNFSFCLPKDPDTFGNFSCLADASEVTKAVIAFEKKIHEVQLSAKPFKQGTEIYLDSVVEIAAPKRPLVAGFIQYVHGGKGLLDSPVLGPVDKGIIAYGWSDSEAEDDEEGHDRPFMKIGAGAARKPTKKTKNAPAKVKHGTKAKKATKAKR